MGNGAHCCAGLWGFLRDARLVSAVQPNVYRLSAANLHHFHELACYVILGALPKLLRVGFAVLCVYLVGCNPMMACV